jgi:TPR repeat protein
MALPTFLILRTKLLPLLAAVCLLYTIDADAKLDTQGESALAELQARAAQGYVKQELELAADYLVGKGVPKDFAQSAYWYRKAADQGNPAAQMYLGYIYSVGMGVSLDSAEAVRWFRRAASSGYPEASVSLAALYLRGEGVKQDTQEALQLLRSAAAKGDGRADAYLGYASYRGLGVPVDRAAAKTWFRMGVKQHDPVAEFWLTVTEDDEPGRAPDLANDVRLLRLSAARGYVPAIHRLGVLLVNHSELPQAPREATELLLSAAEAGSWQSSALLGILARDGQLVPQDQRAAYRWFQIAVSQGRSPADNFLRGELECLAASIPNAAAADREAAAWLQAHPNHDLFVYSNGLNAKYFPIKDVYAATAQAPAADEVGNQTKQPD